MNINLCLLVSFWHPFICGSNIVFATNMITSCNHAGIFFLLVNISEVYFPKSYVFLEIIIKKQLMHYIYRLEKYYHVKKYYYQH